MGRKIEAPRAEGATTKQVRAFLEFFERTRVRLGIRAEDMDETGKVMGYVQTPECSQTVEKRRLTSLLQRTGSGRRQSSVCRPLGRNFVA